MALLFDDRVSCGDGAEKMLCQTCVWRQEGGARKRSQSQQCFSRIDKKEKRVVLIFSDRIYYRRKSHLPLVSGESKRSQSQQCFRRICKGKAISDFF